MEGDYSTYREIELFTHREEFKNKPSVFRLNLNWNGQGRQEVIIIKYSLFIPKEQDGGNEDIFWHDYLLLRPGDALSGWSCTDPAFRNGLPKNMRRSLRHMECPLSQNMALSSFVSYEIEHSKEQLKALLKGGPVPFFPESQDIHGLSMGPFGLRGIPSYIQGSSLKPFSSNFRVFQNLPVFLGHINLPFDEVFRKVNPSILYADIGGHCHNYGLNPNAESSANREVFSFSRITCSKSS